MYILIFEDGTFRKIDSISKDLLKSADDKYVDIINIGIIPPRKYSNGEWQILEDV